MKSAGYDKKLIPFISSMFILLFCSKSPQSSVDLNVDGTLLNGTRIVTVLSPYQNKIIRVYRGDAVELLFDKKTVPVCLIPSLKKEVTLTDKESQLSAKFTAAYTGSYPVISPDGKTIVTLNVREFKTEKTVSIKDLSGKEAVKVLKDTSIFIMDVRTPGEFNSGHIPRANLYPISELSNSVNTLLEYKDKPVFVYCRSGNRSAVAIQILTQKGFSNILHLRKGILSWPGDIVK